MIKNQLNVMISLDHKAKEETLLRRTRSNGGAINQRRDEEIYDLMPDYINNAFKRILEHDRKAYADLMGHLSETLDKAGEEVRA